MHKPRLAKDLRRQIQPRHGQPDQPARRCRLGPRIRRGLSLQQPLPRHLPIAAKRPGRANKRAILDANILDRDAAALRNNGEKNPPRIRRRMAQRHARFLHRERTAGHRLIRARAGGGGQQPHPGRGHIQLLSHDLGEGGENPLPQLHLARPRQHRAIAGKFEPLRQHPVHMQRAGQPGLVILGGVKCEIHAAALNTARMMRLWLWQRQRCGCKAARTASSSGRGLAARRAAALMIMPGMQ